MAIDAPAWAALQAQFEERDAKLAEFQQRIDVFARRVDERFRALDARITRLEAGTRGSRGLEERLEDLEAHAFRSQPRRTDGNHSQPETGGHAPLVVDQVTLQDGRHQQP